MFKFYVGLRDIQIKATDKLVSDSRNVYPCAFTFSKDWDGYNKIVRFRAGEEVQEISLMSGYRCDIPWECLLKPNIHLEVGAYGLQGEDIILNTTWTDLGLIHEGTYDVDVSPPKEPTPDVYQQIITSIGNLEDLTTDDRTNLVVAINEVNNEALTNTDLEGILT